MAAPTAPHPAPSLGASGPEIPAGARPRPEPRPDRQGPNARPDRQASGSRPDRQGPERAAARARLALLCRMTVHAAVGVAAGALLVAARPSTPAWVVALAVAAWTATPLIRVAVR